MVVATSTSNQDDAIVEFSRSIGCTVTRGDEHDVLSRVVQTLEKLEVDLHVECFGDSPLVAPELVDEFIEYFLHSQERADLVSPARLPGVPIGTEFNIYFAHTLFHADNLLEPNDLSRQHVGLTITRFPEKLRCEFLAVSPAFQGDGISLEVDYAEDLDVLDQILRNLRPKLPQEITIEELVLFCRSVPELMAKTAGLHRRWKDHRGM